jgi:hypothetical protein
MEELQHESPVVYREESHKSDTTIGDAVLFLGLAGGLIWLGKNWYDNYTAQQASGRLGISTAAQAASTLWSCKHWYSNDYDTPIQVAKELAEQKIPFADVSKEFDAQGHGNLEDFLDFLGAVKKTEFFNALNLGDTTPGKSPTNAKNQFDTTKNIVVVYANAPAHIRKSPKILGSSVLRAAASSILDPSVIFSALTLNTSTIRTDNIIKEAKDIKSGEFLGILTGNHQLYTGTNSTGGTLFYEFTGIVSGLGTKKMWVAAEFVHLENFQTKEVVNTLMHKEIDSNNALIVTADDYNSAVS